jgi:hypothetical protein
MPIPCSGRFAGPAALLLGAVGLAGAMALTSIASSSAALSVSAPPRVIASLIKAPPGTVKPGTRVNPVTLGVRVFPTARVGFALASLPEAQYPARTTDGGRTWRTDGPALHLNAAQAPLAVTEIGASGRRTAFAYGGGQVVDVTSDGGRHWYRALFEGEAMAVVRGIGGHLVAFVDGAIAPSSSPEIWQYVSRDGGRTWRYTTALGGA